jgi:hypothetical protein
MSRTHQTAAESAADVAGQVRRTQAPRAVRANLGLFLRGLMILGLGLVLSLIGLDANASDWWLPLLAGSGLAALLVWRRCRWPDEWSRYLGFGALVLLACAINRVLYISDLALSGDAYLQWPFTVQQPEVSIIKAELATLIGTMLSVFSWLAAGGARLSPGLLLQAPNRALRRLLLVTYAASLMALVVFVLFPQLYALSGQLLPTMLALGSATAFFVPMLIARRKLTRLVLVVAMGLPFVYVALGSGMKENIILAMIPTAYMLWHYSPRRGPRVALCAIAVLVIALVASYISFFRNEVWYADSAADQSTVLGNYLDAVDADGLGATVASGLEEFLARNDAAPYRGWAIAIADAEGYQPRLVFAPMLEVFVPRVLWPEKPEIRQGWEYSGLVFGSRYAAWNDSSLSAGFYPALYLGYGWLAVILGALGVGWMMAFLTRLAFRLGGPLLVGLFTVAMVPYALRLDEAWTVGAFSGPLISLVYIYLVFLVARFASGLVGREAVARGPARTAR